MDEGRKRVLAIVAGILVARHLKTTEDLLDSKSSPRSESLVAAAVQWAERIMRKIDGVYRYPTAIAEVGDQILVLSGKGHGTHANPDGPVPLTNWPEGKPTAYVLGQLNGSLRVLSASIPPAQLAGFTERVAAANNWQHRPTARRYPPFRHVVYIIKENRTYDQVLGDIKEGDGDAS